VSPIPPARSDGAGSGLTGVRDGEWAVVQQGMNPAARSARRYHWVSEGLASFVEEPHAAVVGEPAGLILNLTAHAAAPTREAMTALAREPPDRLLAEVRHLTMPRRHEVRAHDVDRKRLAAVLVAAHERDARDFAELLLCPGLGPRTLQALALVSEVIHGTPLRFRDPARFSFAHGGKDGHPFPVPVHVYDRSIAVLKEAVGRARLGRSEKLDALRHLDRFVRRVETACNPSVDVQAWIRRETAASPSYGGRTVGGAARALRARPPRAAAPRQLELGIP
jgi:uncharacterized protein